MGLINTVQPNTVSGHGEHGKHKGVKMWMFTYTRVTVYITVYNTDKCGATSSPHVVESVVT